MKWNDKVAGYKLCAISNKYTENDCSNVALNEYQTSKHTDIAMYQMLQHHASV